MREIADALGLSYQRVHQIVDVSTGKGAIRPSAMANLACSFCGAARSAVRMLIAGPAVYICDRCVYVADEVVAEGGQRANERTLLVALDLSNPKARCSFCGKKMDQVREMAHAPLRPGVGKYRKREAGVRICVDCLGLCHEILAEQLGAA
jgi:ATP-dependent protease Clp ATPase subunit